MSPDTDWLRDERSNTARDKLLAVAEDLFFHYGVGEVTMRQIADAAGCSRATLYRYFPGRTDLHLAYVDQVTSLIAAAVTAKTAGITDPADRLTAAVLAALSGVRGNPALMAWFARDTAATTGATAMPSEMIDAVSGRFVELLRGSADAQAARWIVRLIVSFLTVPADDAETEALIRRFLVPVIISADDGRSDPDHSEQL